MAEGTVVTNAHVVASADRVAISSWDGHDAEAMSVTIADHHDLAILTAESVPADPLELADADPQRGDQVMVVGYPGGGRITVEAGAEVVDTVDGARYWPEGTQVVPGDVLRIDADSVQPGSSGGPVLDEAGRVVAVVFAIEESPQEYVLTVPVSVLRGWLDELQDAP